MTDALSIHEHVEVVGSDGQHVGIVEAVEGQWIKLATDDPLARGLQRHVALSKVAFVDERVHLSTTALQAMGAVGGTLTFRAGNGLQHDDAER